MSLLTAVSSLMTSPYNLNPCALANLKVSPNAGLVHKDLKDDIENKLQAGLRKSANRIY